MLTDEEEASRQPPRVDSISYGIAGTVGAGDTVGIAVGVGDAMSVGAGEIVGALVPRNPDT